MLFSSQSIVYKNESTEKKEGKITIKKDARNFFFFERGGWGAVVLFLFLSRVDSVCPPSFIGY